MDAMKTMKTTNTTSEHAEAIGDGGWAAVLDGVEGAASTTAPAAQRSDAWKALDALVHQASGGDATGDLFARVVALVGSYVPPELHDAAEALLRVADGTSSWSGAVIEAAPRPPVVTNPPEASAPVPEPAPAPTVEPAPAPMPAAPAADAAIPDDPTFDAAIGVSGATTSMEVTR